MSSHFIISKGAERMNVGEKDTDGLKIQGKKSTVRRRDE